MRCIRPSMWHILALNGLLLAGCGTSIRDLVSDRQSESSSGATLTIGSPAPPLDIAHWVQNGNGKFSPVTQFESGKVYVVEFWATWCGPCVASMPHLAELQQRYADEVQIVSISDESLKTVEAFLARKVRGEEQTYRELTAAYCLTTDPDRSAYIDYMEAADQHGIPTAFIVGKSGHVEWIGHPMSMDQPLEQIVQDRWSRERFQEEHAASERLQTVMSKTQLAMRQGNTQLALEEVNTALAEASGPVAGRLKQLKLKLLLEEDQDTAAVALLGELSADVEDGAMLNEIGWMVYQHVAAQRGTGAEPRGDEAEGTRELLEAAAVATEKAIGLTRGQMQGYALDTLAHLRFLQGDTAEALKLQTRAVELAPEQPLTEFLTQLKQEKIEE